MPTRWERYLERWTSAGLLEPSAAERIRAYEAEQEKTRRRLVAQLEKGEA